MKTKDTLVHNDINIPAVVATAVSAAPAAAAATCAAVAAIIVAVVAVSAATAADDEDGFTSVMLTVQPWFSFRFTSNNIYCENQIYTF